MTDRETIEVYGAKAADYENFGITSVQIRGLEAFADGLPKGALVFDLGCGPGLHSAWLLERGFAVSGLDATPEFVEAARARGIDARVGTFDEVSEVAVYDAVFASFSLLHLPRAEFPEALGRAARAVKAKGRIYLGMKTGDHDHRDAMGRFYGFHTVAELTAHLGAHGFAVTWSEEGAEAGLAGSVDPFVLMVADRG